MCAKLEVTLVFTKSLISQRSDIMLSGLQYSVWVVGGKCEGPLSRFRISIARRSKTYRVCVNQKGPLFDATSSAVKSEYVRRRPRIDVLACIVIQCALVLAVIPVCVCVCVCVCR